MSRSKAQVNEFITDQEPFKDSFVRSGELDIFVRHNNKKGKETILFVHGYPDKWRTWLHQMDFFAENFQVAAMDLRGFDRSSPPEATEDYAIQEILPDIEAVIDFLQPKDGKVHLVGHDWGSALGWCFVTTPAYQGKVATYSSLAGPHPGVTLDGLRQMLKGDFTDAGARLSQVAYSWYIWLFQMPFIPELFIKAVLRSGLPFWQGFLKLAGVPAGDEMYFWDKKNIEGIMVNGLGLYRQVMREPRPSAPEPGNPIPVQIIYGKKDAFLSPIVFQGYEEFFNDVAVHEVDAGHWLQLEEPELMNSLIEKFIVAGGNHKIRPVGKTTA